jgi:hypothetical protein
MDRAFFIASPPEKEVPFPAQNKTDAGALRRIGSRKEARLPFCESAFGCQNYNTRGLDYQLRTIRYAPTGTKAPIPQAGTFQAQCFGIE